MRLGHDESHQQQRPLLQWPHVLALQHLASYEGFSLSLWGLLRHILHDFA